MAWSTLARVPSLTKALLFSTRLTVATPTPARFATSFIVMTMS